MCHSTHVGASSAIVNDTYRDGRSRAKQIAHCFPDESWCQWMSVKNAISSVTVKTVDIHRPKRRGCKTLITANDKSAASRCANPERYPVPWAIYRHHLRTLDCRSKLERQRFLTINAAAFTHHCPNSCKFGISQKCRCVVAK